MAGRNNKESLDYFELDCHMDEKVRLIRAEYGLKGFAVIVMLYQEIYGGHGYYMNWSEDSLLLFMSENNVGSRKEQNLIKEIVQACIRREIFSEQIYTDFCVLTSAGVQKQYLKATARRESVNMKKEYLLVSIPKNRKNVVINSIYDGRNSIYDGRNEQSRVEKSRVEYIPPISPRETVGRFEDFIKLYPKQVKDRMSAERAYCQLLTDDSSMEESLILDAVKNYAEAVKIEKKEERYIKSASNFLKDNYFADYLPCVYQKPKKPKTKNSFNNFEQREISASEMSNLEKELLRIGGTK